MTMILCLGFRHRFSSSPFFMFFMILQILCFLYLCWLSLSIGDYTISQPASWLQRIGRHGSFQIANSESSGLWFFWLLICLITIGSIHQRHTHSYFRDLLPTFNMLICVLCLPCLSFSFFLIKNNFIQQTWVEEISVVSFLQTICSKWKYIQDSHSFVGSVLGDTNGLNLQQWM